MYDRQVNQIVKIEETGIDVALWTVTGDDENTWGVTVTAEDYHLYTTEFESEYDARIFANQRWRWYYRVAIEHIKPFG